MPQPGELQEISRLLANFAEQRDWDQFHSPKNLSMALAVEVAEIMELFQWMTTEASHELPSEKFEQLKDELADALIYLIRLADIAGIDLMDATKSKIQKNESRYPRDLVKGSAAKYTEYSK